MISSDMVITRDVACCDHLQQSIAFLQRRENRNVEGAFAPRDVNKPRVVNEPPVREGLWGNIKEAQPTVEGIEQCLQQFSAQDEAEGEF